MPEASSHTIPSAVKYAGSSFLVAWFLLFYSGDIWGADFSNAAETVVALSLITIASCFVFLLILNRLGQKGKVFAKPLGATSLMWGALLSAGTVGIIFADTLPLPLFVVSCVAIGCSGSVFICVTVLMLAQLSPRNILINSGGLFLVGILIYSFALYVPSEVTTVVLCVLPFLASLFYIFGTEGVARLDDDLREESDSAESSLRPLSWRAVLLLSIFMLFSCVVRGYLPYQIENATFSYVRSIAIILMLVFTAIVVIVPALLPARYRISNLYRIILIFGIVLFALFPIFGMDNTVALVLADGYRGLCALMAIVYFACLARQAPFFGVRNVCGALALYASFGIIGWFIGSTLHYLNPGEDFLRIYSSLQCVLVVLAFILLYRQSEFEQFVDVDRPLPETADDSSTVKPDSLEGVGVGGRYRQHIISLAREKGLTSREEEVFWLLAKGYKAQNISERLSISYNTTRAHIRNIYQKCDVHSQQEFIDLVESSRPTSD